MSETSSRGENRSGIGIFLIPLLPLIYLLSAGPAQWLDLRGYLSNSMREILTVFYAPIGWLMESSELIKQILVWYSSLWEFVRISI